MCLHLFLQPFYAFGAPKVAKTSVNSFLLIFRSFQGDFIPYFLFCRNLGQGKYDLNPPLSFLYPSNIAHLSSSSLKIAKIILLINVHSQAQLVWIAFILYMTEHLAPPKEIDLRKHSEIVKKNIFKFYVKLHKLL